jgi:hypothetical protein
MHSLAGNGGSTVGELVEPLNPSPFFIDGRQHFDSLKKGKLEKLHRTNYSPAMFIIWPCLTLLLSIRHGKISFKCCVVAFNFHLQP